MPRELDVAVLPASDPAVDAELGTFMEACPTSFAQQTPGWRNVVTSIDRDEPLFLGCRHAGRLVGVLPAYRFEGPLGAILTSAAQAGPLGGVACLPETDPAPVYEALLGAFAELATSTGCALATVITNPFWPDRDLCERYLSPDYVLTNVCQVLDLAEALDVDGNFICGSTNLRRNLRKAQTAPLRVDEEQSRRSVEDWYEIHTARHRDIGATPLPKQLFIHALEHMVPRDKARFFFIRLADSGRLVAGGFYVYHGAVIDALMPSVGTEFARLGPVYLLGLRSIQWARKRGLRYYNWQPSPPDGGVHRFKLQWGSRDAAYCYLTRITGDVEPFLRSSVDAIASGYRWHYVLPFDRVGADATAVRGPSSRKAAWSALEAAKR
jgi:hypothetical protein